MTNEFKQISLKQGFMKHNGGVMFRDISDTEYEFKSTINENHLNAAGITHGGYLSALVDAGAGTAAHRSANNAPCVTSEFRQHLQILNVYQLALTQPYIKNI